MDPSMDALTEREVFVLHARANGWDNARIALALGISKPRVSQIAAHATHERDLARARARVRQKERDADPLIQAETAVQDVYVWLVRARALLAWGRPLIVSWPALPQTRGDT